MARGTTLEELVANLRAEIGQTTNTSVSRASLDMLTTTLRRVQERLWNDFDWPHMRVQRDIQMQAGDRYYDFPTDIDLTRIEKMEIKFGGRWIPVQHGISVEDFAVMDSDLDVRNDPVARWDYYNGESGDTDNQFEVWPIPATNGTEASKEGYVKITGIKRLRPLVAMSDVADLDDWLLILYAASELLARLKTPDAAAKLEAANLYYARIKGRQAGRKEPFKIGGECEEKESGIRLRVAYADQDGNIFS